MSVVVSPLHLASQRPGLLGTLFARERVFAGTALMMLAMMPPTLLAMALDARTLDGVNVWIKPLKFEIALALYLGTLAWFAGWLPSGYLRSRTHRLLAPAVAFATAAEMAWIGGAAHMGVASHFNVATPLASALYPVMGLLAIVITLPSLTLGLAFLRSGSALPSAFRLSLGLGLTTTFVLTVLVAGFMAAAAPGHGVGGTASQAAGLPLLGWSRDGGDLRVAHFFATHAMHFVPAVGFLAVRLLPTRTARGTVLAGALGFVALVVYAFVEALMGLPFPSLAFS